jgi:hypothetical protein
VWCPAVPALDMSAKYAADIGSASEKFPASWLNMTTG